jgi:hypothetical protein
VTLFQTLLQVSGLASGTVCHVRSPHGVCDGQNQAERTKDPAAASSPPAQGPRFRSNRYRSGRVAPLNAEVRAGMPAGSAGRPLEGVRRERRRADVDAGFPPPPEQRVTLARPYGSRSRSGEGAADRTPDRWAAPAPATGVAVLRCHSGSSGATTYAAGQTCHGVVSSRASRAAAWGPVRSPERVHSART